MHDHHAEKHEEPKGRIAALRVFLRSVREMICRYIVIAMPSIILGAWKVLTIPVKIVEAIFYAYKIDEEGEIVSSRFSLIKTVFSVTTFIMMFKIFTGGSVFHDVKIGFEVEDARIVISSASGKRRPRKISRVTKGTRPFFYIKKYTGSQITQMDILFYLIIACLFYFKDDFSRGDQRNVFGSIVDLLVQAKAMQISGGKLTVPVVEVKKQAEVKKQDKGDKKINRKKKKVLPMSDDPFM